MEKDGLGLKRRREKDYKDKEHEDDRDKKKKKKLKKEEKKKKKHKKTKKDKRKKKKRQRRLDSSDEEKRNGSQSESSKSELGLEYSDESTTGDDHSSVSRRHGVDKSSASGSVPSAASASWYESILREEKSKPKIGTVHATNEGRKYVRNYTTGEAMDAGAIEEDMEKSKLWWKCTKCGKENYKLNPQCEHCNAMKRLG